MTVKLRRGVQNGSRACLELGPRLVEAGASSLTLHPRSAQQMYTGTADHALTAELVSLVDVPVVASGDVTSRARAQAVLATTGAEAVMVGRGAQGNPWALREIVDGDAAEPTREEVAAELVLFVRETVRELGERRASGFLKKFYGWYLGGGASRRSSSRSSCSSTRPRRSSDGCSPQRRVPTRSSSGSRRRSRRARSSRSSSRSRSTAAASRPR